MAVFIIYIFCWIPRLQAYNAVHLNVVYVIIPIYYTTFSQLDIFPSNLMQTSPSILYHIYKNL